MDDNLPTLYVKTGCPWCREVQNFMVAQGIDHRESNVSDDSAALEAMERMSGQSNAPTLTWNGSVLADFRLEELVKFLEKHEA
jgi:glutaredoxin